MKTIFQPRHTISSVAQRLSAGLADGSITFKKTVRNRIINLNEIAETVRHRPEDSPSIVGIFLALLLWVGVSSYVIFGSPDAERLNIGVSLMMLMAGLVIFFFFPPNIFERYPYTRQAFLFWTLRWPVLTCTWSFAHYLQSQKHLILMMADLTSMLSLAFCWSFLSGKKLGRRQFKQLSFVFCVLILWNFFGGSGQALITPSEIVTLISIAMTVLVFALRNGVSAISFACVVLISAMFQIPAYNQLVLNSPLTSNLLAQPSLGVGKLLSGSIFYAMFSFSPASANFGPIKFPQIPRVNLSEAFRVAVFVLIPSLVGVAVLFGVSTTYLLHLMSFHLLSAFVILGLSFWILFLTLKWDQLLVLLKAGTDKSQREVHGPLGLS